MRRKYIADMLAQQAQVQAHALSAFLLFLTKFGGALSDLTIRITSWVSVRVLPESLNGARKELLYRSRLERLNALKAEDKRAGSDYSSLYLQSCRFPQLTYSRINSCSLLFRLLIPFQSVCRSGDVIVGTVKEKPGELRNLVMYESSI
jgi:hypothetical protein